MFAIRVTVSILASITLIIYLVSIVTDYWQQTHYKYGNYNPLMIETTHSGLWNGCYIKENKEFCGHIHLEAHWLKAVKAFMILGMIANLVAVIYLVLAFIKEDIIFKIVGIFLAINALFILIGLSVYAGKSGIPFKKPYEQGSFSWSFIIAWVSWVLTIAAAVISFFDDEEPPFQDYDEGTHYH